MDELKEIIDNYLSLSFRLGLILVILSTLFLSLNLTTELYDTPKFLVFLIFTAALLVFLMVKFTVVGKVTFIRTPLDIPLLLLLAVAIVSTILSPSPYVALLGNQLKIHGSLASLVVYVMFYFVLVNNFKTKREIKWILYFILFAGQILAVITLLSYAGVKVLPLSWAQALNFTPTGGSFSTSAILALLIPLAVTRILLEGSLPAKIINSLFLTLMAVTIALTGSLPTWMAGLFALVLTFLAISPVKKLERLSQLNPVSLMGLAVPLVVIGLVMALSLIPPIGSAKNPLYSRARNFPREIQLGFIESWKISVSSFRDSPLWGTGPATYLFNFTNYKPPEFNSTKIWNLRFDNPFNEYLQVLSTLGGIGLVALLSLTALFISSAYKILAHALLSRDAELPAGNYQLQIVLAVSGVTFFILLALHSSTLPLWVMGLIFLASFMAGDISERMQRNWGMAVEDLKVMFSKPSEETIKTDALPGILLTISLAAVAFTLIYGGKMVLADYHHRKALNAVTRNDGIATYNELVAAEKLNPNSDLYRTDLAQTNFALANAIALAKGPTEASPGGSLTDQDKQNIQVLLQQSIDEAKNAVTLSPRSAINWEILGLLYRQIAGVAQNALQFSLDAYGRAIFQDPLNPQLRLNVGGVYYAVKNYDLAIRFFTDSINLKPDFANGYYNLSVALRDKGDPQTALVSAQKVLELVEKDSQDYKVASDYLADLKARIASGSARQSEIEPPAAKTSGALQQKELPKVINLPQPEKIATPEAVKKPSPTPTPTP